MPFFVTSSPVNLQCDISHCGLFVFPQWNWTSFYIVMGHSWSSNSGSLLCMVSCWVSSKRKCGLHYQSFLSLSVVYAFLSYGVGLFTITSASRPFYLISASLCLAQLGSLAFCERIVKFFATLKSWYGCSFLTNLEELLLYSRKQCSYE